MNDSEKIISPLSLIEHYFKVLVGTWAIIVAASLVWSIVRLKKETLEGAKIQAHVTYVKDHIIPSLECYAWWSLCSSDQRDTA